MNGSPAIIGRALAVIGVGLALGITPTLACGRSETRVEAERVFHALDKLRSAQNAGKGPLLAQLKGTPCAEPRVCNVRDLCEAAYRQLVDGVELQQKVRGELDRLEKVPPTDRSQFVDLAQSLDHAEGLLNDAKASLPSCEAASVALRRELKL